MVQEHQIDQHWLVTNGIHFSYGFIAWMIENGFILPDAYLETGGRVGLYDPESITAQLDEFCENGLLFGYRMVYAFSRSGGLDRYSAHKMAVRVAMESKQGILVSAHL